MIKKKKNLVQDMLNAGGSMPSLFGNLRLMEERFNLALTSPINSSTLNDLFHEIISEIIRMRALQRLIQTKIDAPSSELESFTAKLKAQVISENEDFQLSLQKHLRKSLQLEQELKKRDALTSKNIKSKLSTSSFLSPGHR